MGDREREWILKIAEENDCLVERDPVKIELVVDSVLSDNQKMVSDYINGKEAAYKSIFGKVIGRIGKYKADPELIKQILDLKLQKLKGDLR